MRLNGTGNLAAYELSDFQNAIEGIFAAFDIGVDFNGANPISVNVGAPQVPVYGDPNGTVLGCTFSHGEGCVPVMNYPVMKDVAYLAGYDVFSVLSHGATLWVGLAMGRAASHEIIHAMELPHSSGIMAPTAGSKYWNPVASSQSFSLSPQWVKRLQKKCKSRQKSGAVRSFPGGGLYILVNFGSVENPNVGLVWWPGPPNPVSHQLLPY